MGQKKDIGEVFETRLKDGKKSPSNELWHRLDKSLDQREQTKKKNLLYWLIGGGSAILIGISLIFSTNILSSDTTTSQKNLHPKKESVISIDKDHKEMESDIEADDPIITHRMEDKLIEKTTTSKENTQQQPQEDPKKKSKVKNTEKIKTKPVDAWNIDNTDEITKNYYYYNSQDGKQLVTDRKEVIDSLMDENRRKPDSIPSDIQDTIGL